MDAVSEFRRIPSVLNGEMVRFFGIEQIRPDRLLYEELIKDLPEDLRSLLEPFAFSEDEARTQLLGTK